MTGIRLGQLMEEASQHLEDVDLADAAWSAAVEQRARRRRAVLRGCAGAAAAALVIGVLVARDQPRADRVTPAPAPATSPSPVATDRATDGTLLVQAPTTEDEATLPARATHLPAEITLDRPATPLGVLGEGALTRIAAAYLRPGDSDGRFRPVLVAQDGRLVDPGLTLRETADAEGNTASPLDRAAIARDGSGIAFAQPGEVVLFELPGATVRRIPVPDQAIQRVGWTAGDTGLVARSDTRSWFVDLRAGSATRLSQRAAPSHYEIVAGGGGAPRLLTWDAFGRATGQESLPAPVQGVYSNTVGNIVGWAAAGVFLDSEGGTRQYQGILAVQADKPSSRRLLVFGDPQSRQKGCCVPLGWLSGHELLFQSSGAQGSHVLVWDITSGAVSRVARVTGGAAGGANAVAVAIP
ncbi:MAG TPA: hypothetical protein VH915_10685 [Pedococcus sp.]|jgi:hypothetical protein